MFPMCSAKRFLALALFLFLLRCENGTSTRHNNTTLLRNAYMLLEESYIVKISQTHKPMLRPDGASVCSVHLRWFTPALQGSHYHRR